MAVGTSPPPDADREGAVPAEPAAPPGSAAPPGKGAPPGAGTTPPASPRRPPRPGRRRRRLRWAAVLATAALATVALGAWSSLSSRTDVRRPGEDLPEITDRLAQGLPADAPTPVFTDVTAAAGLDGFRSFAGRRTSRLPEDMGAGAAWGDYDGDGDDDLFLVAAGGSLDLPPAERRPSQLYENLGDGTFRLVDGFPDTRILGMAAAWGDADGDGDLDLAVSGYGELLLFRNLGGGRFERDLDFPSPDGYWAGIAWGDFDGDGDLDLYVSGYVRFVDAGDGPRRVSDQYGAAVPYTLNPAAFEPEANLLLENRGDGTFVDVAALYGVSNPGGRSLGALWHDFDDDGRLDLYVANDISDNALFLNRGDTFEDAGLAAWVSDYRGAMGLAAGDWNRDGDDDLFVTHWLAQENALYDSRLRSEAPPPKSRLLAPRGAAPPPRLTFSDLSAPLGLGPVALPLVGWGTEFLDFDRDGWLDLVVANGSTLEDKADPSKLVPQKPLLLWNRRGEAFHDLAPLSPALAVPRSARGLAVSDFDGDGDLDLLIVHLDGGVQLLRNDTAGGRFLTLGLRNRLPGGGFGRGEAAVAVAWVGGVPLRRTVGGVSYLSQSTATLHFGLGEAARVDRLEVRWPDGTVELYGPLPADSHWQLTQGEPAPRRLAGSGSAAAATATPTAGGAAAPLDRQQIIAFWGAQRAAMDAMKRRGDLDEAVRLFRQALAIDPGHEDSRYYLADCLWLQDHRDEALAELDELRRRSPRSHRAHLHWATLRAVSARTQADLAAAAEAAERALAINREETGALLLLGEIALLRGEPRQADRHLEHACRTNPRAVGGFFLRGHLAWQAGDVEGASVLLRQAAAARGPEWKPEGAAAEGDVAARMHRDGSPLAAYWEAWDGSPDPAAAFAPLAARLARRPGA
jgi:enediyne biosynthesis protein E4